MAVPRSGHPASKIVAQFLRPDSRDRDPQWHVHQAILNRVLCADGVWRALDSRAINAARAAAGAIAERVMEAHLNQSVGARLDWRADGKAREVVGVDRDVLDLFSSRARAIEPRVREMVAGYEARFGRPPSPYERAVIAQQVTLATRRAKSHEGETLAEQLDRWQAMAADRVAGGLAPIAAEVLARGQQAGPAQEFSPWTWWSGRSPPWGTTASTTATTTCSRPSPTPCPGTSTYRPRTCCHCCSG